MPPAPGQPVGAECAGHPEALDRGGAQQELAVRRKSFRSVQELDHFGCLHRRHALDGVFHQRRKTLPVGRQELVLEVARDAVQAERSRVALVTTRDQPANLLAPVDQQVGVAQGWEIVPHTLDGFGDDVQVRHRDDRQVEPDHLPDLASPLPGRVHNHLGLDRALVGDHLVDATVLQVDLLHVGVGKNARPALLGAGGQGIGQAGRVDDAIVGGEGRTDDPFRVHDREQIKGLLG